MYRIGWYPNCYMTFRNVLPTPVISLLEGGQQNIYVAPDAAMLVGSLGEQFTGFYDKLGFDWKRLAGAKVVEVEGKDAWHYIDDLATTQAGTYLDHGVRVNSLFTGYLVVNSTWSQVFGLFADRQFPDKDHLTMKVIPVGSAKAEKIRVPFFAAYLGDKFADKAS